MNENEKNFFLVYDYLYQIEDLNLNDIIIYSIIMGLSTNGNKCYATNSYFAQKIKKNNDTARKSITKLFEKGYINYTEDFNYQSNRVLTITNKIDTYLKTVEGLLKNNRVSLAKTSNNNISNNININTSTTTKKLESNLDLIEGISKDLNVDKKNVYDKIPEFIKFIKEVRRVHKSDSDLFLNFKSWMRTRESNIKVNLEESEENYLWFLNLFNTITKRFFKPSDITRELFYNQLKNGFTGDDFRNAIKNLYSSNPANKFHIDNSFQFATPKFLLKDDNVNKFLNVRWGLKNDWQEVIPKRNKIV